MRLSSGCNGDSVRITALGGVNVVRRWVWACTWITGSVESDHPPPGGNLITKEIRVSSCYLRGEKVRQGGVGGDKGAKRSLGPRPPGSVVSKNSNARGVLQPQKKRVCSGGGRG